MIQFPGMTADDIKVFLIEADEQLQMLEDGLLALEQGRHDETVIGDLFRAAHTLKGSSATLGHEKMAELTHAMESVLDGVRKAQMAVTPMMMDTMFECLDILRVLNREISSGQDSGADVSGLIGRLLDLVACAEGGRSANSEGMTPGADGAKCASTAAECEKAAEGVADAMAGAARLDVSFTANCPMPSVRAYQVVDRLSSLARVLWTDPAMDRVEAGVDMGAIVVMVEWHEESTAELVEAAKSISDVETVTVSNGSQLEMGATIAEAAAAAFPATPVEKQATTAHQSTGKALGAGAASKSTTVRVDVARLDTLSNLVAEMVIDRTHLAQLESKLAEKHGGDELVSELNRTSTHIGRLTTELQEAINKARMLPIDNVFKRFPRMVRDLAQKHGKEVDFIVEGEDTELDRSVSEEIGDPIIHLLRNAIGHGIETPAERIAAGKPQRGTVKLSAFHQENYIVIQVSDDGQGIDTEAVKASAVRKGQISEEAAARLSTKDAMNLIFAPGLSTAEVVDEVSGRGVGMDIVRKNIERLNGSVSIDSVPGKGATFTVKLPLTLAIIRALLVALVNRMYAVPLASVVEIRRVELGDIQSVRGREAILLRGEIIPLVWLSDVFSVREASEDRTRRIFVVITSSHEGQVGLVVDSLAGEMEIVIKSLGSYIGSISGVSGVTILGDGRVALIVDVPSLVRRVVEERNAE
ncbi:MAG: chemotaxis protein CheA [Clostridia bacterium]|nr:chemotaxis protein CheA [Clostridia bacterium]